MRRMIVSHQPRNYARSQSQRKKSRNGANFKGINKELGIPKNGKKNALKLPWKNTKTNTSKPKASTPKGNIKYRTDFNNEIKKKVLKRNVNSLKNLTAKVIPPE